MLEIEVNAPAILFIFFLEMVAFALWAKAGGRVRDVPDALCDVFLKLKSLFKRPER